MGCHHELTRGQKGGKVAAEFLRRQKYSRNHCLVDSHLPGSSGPVRMVSGDFVSKPALNPCGFDAASLVAAVRATGSRLLAQSVLDIMTLLKKLKHHLLLQRNLWSLVGPNRPWVRLNSGVSRCTSSSLCVDDGRGRAAAIGTGVLRWSVLLNLNLAKAIVGS